MILWQHCGKRGTGQHLIQMFLPSLIDRNCLVLLPHPLSMCLSSVYGGGGHYGGGAILPRVKFKIFRGPFRGSNTLPPHKEPQSHKDLGRDRSWSHFWHKNVFCHFLGKIHERKTMELRWRTWPYRRLVNSTHISIFLSLYLCSRNIVLTIFLQFPRNCSKKISIFNNSLIWWRVIWGLPRAGFFLLWPMTMFSPRPQMRLPQNTLCGKVIEFCWTATPTTPPQRVQPKAGFMQYEENPKYQAATKKYLFFDPPDP